MDNPNGRKTPPRSGTAGKPPITTEPDLPLPLVSAGVDLQTYRFLPIDTVSILRTRLWRLSEDDPRIFFHAFNLMIYAFHEVPAGTLPYDPEALRFAARVSHPDWEGLSASVLDGWFLASDGRLHHSIMAEAMNVLWERKVAHRRPKAVADDEGRRASGPRRKTGRPTRAEAEARAAREAREGTLTINQKARDARKARRRRQTASRLGETTAIEAEDHPGDAPSRHPPVVSVATPQKRPKKAIGKAKDLARGKTTVTANPTSGKLLIKDDFETSKEEEDAVLYQLLAEADDENLSPYSDHSYVLYGDKYIENKDKILSKRPTKENVKERGQGDLSYSAAVGRYSPHARGSQRASGRGLGPDWFDQPGVVANLPHGFEAYPDRRRPWWAASVEISDEDGHAYVAEERIDHLENVVLEMLGLPWDWTGDVGLLVAWREAGISSNAIAVTLHDEVSSEGYVPPVDDLRSFDEIVRRRGAEWDERVRS